MTRLLFLFTCGEEESNASGKRTQPGVKMWRTRVTLTHSPFTFTLPFVGGWVCVEGRRWGEGVRWGVGGGEKEDRSSFVSITHRFTPAGWTIFFLSCIYNYMLFFFLDIFASSSSTVSSTSPAQSVHPLLLYHVAWIASWTISFPTLRPDLAFFKFFSCRFFAEVNESSGKRQILRVTKLSAVFFFKKKGRFLR